MAWWHLVHYLLFSFVSLSKCILVCLGKGDSDIPSLKCLPGVAGISQAAFPENENWGNSGDWLPQSRERLDSSTLHSAQPPVLQWSPMWQTRSINEMGSQATLVCNWVMGEKAGYQSMTKRRVSWQRRHGEGASSSNTGLLIQQLPTAMAVFLILVGGNGSGGGGILQALPRANSASTPSKDSGSTHPLY